MSTSMMTAQQSSTGRQPIPRIFWGIGILILAALVAIVWIARPAPPPVRSQTVLGLSADSLAIGPSAYLLAEIKDYRGYIEAERREYQDFLTRIYSIIGVLLAALSGILGFLGLRSLQDLRDKGFREIEQARDAIRQEVEAQMRHDLGRLVEEKLSEKEHLVTALQSLAAKQAVWDRARIRIIAPAAELAKMGEVELGYFGQAQLDTQPWQETEPIPDCDALIYVYQYAEGEGADPGLGKVLAALRGRRIPLIVYNYYHPAPLIDKADKAALDRYPFGVLANAPFTLIANTYDAITLHRRDA